VLFATWRANKCKIAYIYCVFCKSEHSKVQNNLYLLCVLQSGELKSAKYLIFTVLFSIRRAQICKIAYIYCAFCNYGPLGPSWTPNLASTARSQPLQKWVPGAALSIDFDPAKGTPFAGVQHRLINSK